jgi:hypothetical protein
VPRGDADPAGGVLRAGGVPLGVRSALRLQGYRFVKLMQQPLITPTLQLHGALDTATLPRTAQGSGRYVIAPYEWRLIPTPATSCTRRPPTGDRRDPALAEDPAASDAVLVEVGDLVRRGPALVDAEVELLEAELRGDRARPPVYSTRSQASASASTMNGWPRHVQVVRT